MKIYKTGGNCSVVLLELSVDNTFFADLPYINNEMLDLFTQDMSTADV